MKETFAEDDFSPCKPRGTCIILPSPSDLFFSLDKQAGDGEKSVSENNELQYRRMMQIPAEKLFFLFFLATFFRPVFFALFGNTGSGVATGT